MALPPSEFRDTKDGPNRVSISAAVLAWWSTPAWANSLAIHAATSSAVTGFLDATLAALHSCKEIGNVIHPELGPAVIGEPLPSLAKLLHRLAVLVF